MITPIHRIKSFAGTARYLVTDDPDRVAWQTTRGLLADDAMDVAKEMEGRADRNKRVEYPGLHISISLHPEDDVTPKDLEAIADRTLKDLELDGYQALYVAHNDTNHPHVHMLVNRVGRDGKAWDPVFSRRRIRKSAETQEQERGLHKTGLNLAHNHFKAMAKDTHDHFEARDKNVRRLSNDFRKKLDEVRPGLEKAQSDEAVRQALKKEGLSLGENGQITDGTERISVKALSKAYLKQGRLADRAPKERVSVLKRNGAAEIGALTREAIEPAQDEGDMIRKGGRLFGIAGSFLSRTEQRTWTVEEIKDESDRYLNAQALEEERGHLNGLITEYEDELSRDDHWQGKLQESQSRFDEVMREVYQDPDAAKAKFWEKTKEQGIEKMSQEMRQTPEELGTLKETKEKGILFTRMSKEDARDAASDAATKAKTLHIHQSRAMDSKARQALQRDMARARKQIQKIDRQLGKGSRQIMKRIQEGARGLGKGQMKKLLNVVPGKVRTALEVKERVTGRGY